MGRGHARRRVHPRTSKCTWVHRRRYGSRALFTLASMNLHNKAQREDRGKAARVAPQPGAHKVAKRTVSHTNVAGDHSKHAGECDARTHTRTASTHPLRSCTPQPESMRMHLSAPMIT